MLAFIWIFLLKLLYLTVGSFVGLNSGAPHYDARYAKYVLDEPVQLEAIKVLLQTYLATFRDIGVNTWLMHGSLLGWWWGKKVGYRIHDGGAGVHVTAMRNICLWLASLF